MSRFPSLPRVAAFLALALAAGAALPARAAFLRDVPVRLAQPDGTPVDLRVTGDEFHRRLHDGAGFTVVRDPVSGWLVYGRRLGGDLVPTGLAAGLDDPRVAGLAPGLDLDSRQVLESTSARRASRQWAPQRLLKGEVVNLTIFVRFEGDDEMTERIEDYEREFNDVADGATSQRAFFREASGGLLDVATVFLPPPDADGWAVAYTDPHTRGYYGVYHAAANPGGYRDDHEAQQREHALLQTVLQAVEAQVPEELDLDSDDDGVVDNVVFLIEGPPGDPWSGLLWPHKWSFYEDVPFRGSMVGTYNMNFTGSLLFSPGTFSHEYAHSLGAPDLYHYNLDDLTPVGPWDVMESTGSPPQHPLAYLKWRYLGWIDEPPLVEHGATVRLSASWAAGTQAVRVQAGPDPDQSFWLEYRVKAGPFESSLPGSGVLVYRIDDNVWGNGNASGPPDEVYVFRPGGRPGVRGKVGLAPLGAFTGRDRMNESTDPAPFLQDGTPVTLRVYDVVEDAEGVSLKVCLVAPDCGDQQCGDDGCGGSCGTCGDGTHCVDAACIACSCDGKACGDDGCGVSCGTCDDGDPCTADACVDGACTTPPAADGTACDDGNGCTRADTCAAGACTGADPLPCPAAGACEVEGTCDPASGACVAAFAAAGAACDDGDPCTTGDRCDGAGACAGAGACVPDEVPDAGGGDPGTVADVPPGDLAGDPANGDEGLPDTGKKGGKGGCAAGLPGASPVPLLLLAGLLWAARRRRP